MKSYSLIKRIILLGIVFLLFTGTLILSGCATGSPIQLGGVTVGDSHHTKESDRQNTITVQDIDGNLYTNVLYVASPTDLSLDNALLRAYLTDSGVNWYQVIAGNRMGSPNKEKAYVYLSAAASFTDLINTQSLLLNSGYECVLLTPEQYQEYLTSVNPNDVYYNETTYFGPAATS